ncbi:unnamed protein product [Cylicocyclus nassatus]|uniref:Hyaluronidase n=1 Tax=Cylicocyclus nassatus TaxID=53992 RepID=A0AA36H825_CYLNA|nr:unnamed protein product [Cylicocyclus nassatus]
MKMIGVSAPLLFLLPVWLKAFSTIWEYPTEQCHKKNGTTYIDFKKYNITTNSNFKFNGDQIVIFYEDTFGLYPYYENYSMDHPVNGGLPQKCDLKAHLKKAKEDIKTNIPDENFSGLAIIDFERWRPLFSENDYMKKRVFQNESIRMHSGTLNGTNISDDDYRDYYSKAEVEFNHHAKMAFIFQASQALFPSVYLGSSTKTQKPLQRFRYVQAVLRETRRISKRHKQLPIYAYTKFEYDQIGVTSDFYDVHDLCAGIAQPIFLGVDGLILWSSSSHMAARCIGIKEEVNKRVGPLISKLTEARIKCSEELCNSTGRCIRRGFKNQWCPMPKLKVWEYEYNKDEYACECIREYKFPNCIKVENGPAPKK